MTVLENVAIGAHLRGHAGAISSMLRLDRADEAKLLAEAARQIERVGLADQIDQLAGSLSLGQQRIVEIARALCVDPMLLLLDEPAAGLRHMEKQQLAALLRQLRDGGMSVLLVEHDMGFVMDLADRIVVLDFGTKIAEGTPGRDQDQSRRDQGLSRSGRMSALLSVADAHVAYGKVEAVRCGLARGRRQRDRHHHRRQRRRQDHAAERHHGHPAADRRRAPLPAADIAQLDIEDRVAAGLSLVPEHRELFGTMNVEDNLQLGAFRIAKAIAARSLERVYTLFPRLKERRKQLAGTLSGGEQQMLAMGRALMGAPKLLMLDEPSLGLAPIIVADIFRTVGELRAAGVSVLLVEQNAQAALKIADRAYVMELGEFILNGPASEIAANARVAASYLGFQHEGESGI